jgi:hypothetical protein
MKRVTVILIALCIALFVGVASLGVRFINTSLPEEQEGFTAQSVVVTRASDCNCLPGYIATNSPSSGYNGKIFNAILNFDWNGGRSIYMFVPDGEANHYQLNPQNPCGIPHIYGPSEPNAGNYPVMSYSDFRAKYPGGGNWVSCGQVKKVESTDSSNYFCKNLVDPGKIRKCY